MSKHLHHLYFFIIFLISSSCSTNQATGEKIFILTSKNQEASLGKQAYQEIIQKETQTKNLALAKRIEIIGMRLAKVSGVTGYVWEFKTFENSTPNAFCLPGGKVGVYTGILDMAKNDAGLAAVLGHEIGHAIARHGGQRLSQEFLTKSALAALSLTALSRMPSEKKDITMGLLGAGLTVGIILPFSRDNETEADEIGLKLMSLAGYDPQEAIKFWDRFSTEQNVGPSFLSTHPKSADRRDHLKEILPDALNIYQSIEQKKGLGLSF